MLPFPRRCFSLGPALLVALLLPVAVPAAAESSSHWGALTDAVIARNQVAEAVAVSKWYSGRPVEDPAREAQILDSVRAQAGLQGLEPADAARWFQSLLAASRAVQQQRLDQWRAQGHGPDVPAPPLEPLREQLDQLQGLLLHALSEQQEHRAAPGCNASLAGQADAASAGYALDPVQRDALLQALQGVCHPMAGENAAR